MKEMVKLPVLPKIAYNQSIRNALTGTVSRKKDREGTIG
jgi:hypothetical protein